MVRGYVSVNHAADLAGRDRRDFRRELRGLHDQHGEVLYQFSGAPNAKLWTTLGALGKWIPEVFGEVTAIDIAELRELYLDNSRRITRLERRLDRKK